MTVLDNDRTAVEMNSGSLMSTPEARKMVEDPASIKANMDKVFDLLGHVGMKIPSDLTKGIINEYRDIFGQIDSKNMSKNESMKFLTGKIDQLKVEVDTFKIREATAGSALGVMNLNSSDGEKKEPFLTKEQKYMVIMGVAILAAIIALAYINPVWAGKAAIALISVLGGVVVINGTKSKPESAVKALLPGSNIVAV